MKRKRCTEERITSILKEHEAGISVADLCRTHGVSEATVYKWKAKFGSVVASEGRECCAIGPSNNGGAP